MKKEYTPEQLQERKKFMIKVAIYTGILAAILISISALWTFLYILPNEGTYSTASTYDFNPVPWLWSILLVVGISIAVSTGIYIYYRKVKKEVDAGTYKSKKQKKQEKTNPELAIANATQSENKDTYVDDLRRM